MNLPSQDRPPDLRQLFPPGNPVHISPLPLDLLALTPNVRKPERFSHILPVTDMPPPAVQTGAEIDGSDGDSTERAIQRTLGIYGASDEQNQAVGPESPDNVGVPVGIGAAALDISAAPEPPATSDRPKISQTDSTERETSVNDTPQVTAPDKQEVLAKDRGTACDATDATECVTKAADRPKGYDAAYSHEPTDAQRTTLASLKEISADRPLEKFDNRRRDRIEGFAGAEPWDGAETQLVIGRILRYHGVDSSQIDFCRSSETITTADFRYLDNNVRVCAFHGASITNVLTCNGAVPQGERDTVWRGYYEIMEDGMATAATYSHLMHQSASEWPDELIIPNETLETIEPKFNTHFQRLHEYAISYGIFEIIIDTPFLRHAIPLGLLLTKQPLADVIDIIGSRTRISGSFYTVGATGLRTTGNPSVLWGVDHNGMLRPV